MNAAYCSDQSWQVGEQLFGTVSTVTTWFLLEYNGRWETKAFKASTIPDPVKEQLTQHLSAIPGSRLQLLRQHPRIAPDGIAFYIVLARETEPALYTFQLESYDDLLTLDIPAIVAGDERYNSHLRGDPLFLVCTNGRRDICCAAYGRPVYTALSKIVGASVWQTSHVGGHRFAANVIAFPHAIYQGRVRSENVPDLVDAYQNSQMHLDTYRGRACYSKTVQAAEYFLRTETGNTDLDAFRWLDTVPEEPDQWRIRFASNEDNATHTLTITQTKSEFVIYESCGDAEAHHVPQFSLLDYRGQSAMAAFSIREAVPGDAAAFIALIKSVVAEYPDVDMPFTPEEYNPTVEGIEDWITKSGETDNALFLVAVSNDQVIGTLICQGGRLAADRHDTSLSIYVHQDWRNQHVGHALMQRAIDWAKNTGVIERIHLEVYARNQRGIHLYEKFGFEHEGRKRRAYYQGGEYIDMLLMSLLL